MHVIGITGGLGFIGTNLIALLTKQSDVKIRILDNLSNPSGSLEITPEVELIEGDITEQNTVNNFVKGTDTIIHLAAHTRVIDSIHDPDINFNSNVIGSFYLLEAMRQNKVNTLINASTGGAILGEAAPPINEEMPARPSSPYGASKLAIEGYCWAYAQSYGLNATSLRFSNLYGRFSKNKDSVVAAFIKAILKGKPLTVYGDGSQIRDYLYIDDLVSGIIKTIEAKVSGVYQLGSGIPVSINQLIQVFREVTGQEIPVIYKDFRAGEITHTYCDISKARKELGFSPSTPLSEGIEKTWNWFQTASND